MNKYDAQTPCKKCGATGASTVLQDSLAFLTAGTRSYPLLKRECQRCGYAWYELPLDAKDAVSIPEEKPVEEGTPCLTPTE